MPHREIQCPLCDTLRSQLLQGTGDGVKIQCPVCGRFRMTGPLQSVVRQKQFQVLRPYVSIHTRLRYEQGPKDDEEGSSPLLSTDNFEALARSQMGYSVPQKATKLLELLQRRTQSPGRFAAFSVSTDYPLVAATSTAEADFYLKHLYKADMIVGDGTGDQFQITMAGWEHLAVPVAGGIPGTCFVAMSFEPELDPVLDEALRPSIEADCGFRLVRVDRVEHNENINDKIVADIRSAQFVVADFTHHKSGVYFEAGFALGLGRVVIWTCRETDFDKTHFDTRPYNHILWATTEDLRQRLTARIRATISLAPRLS